MSLLLLCIHAAGLLPGNLLEGYGTRIWLQLKPECDIKGLVDQLHVLDPFMLLNLRKLRWGVGRCSSP